MNQRQNQFYFALLLVAIAAGSRLLFNALGVYNFNAVIGGAFFGGAFLMRHRLSLFVPMAAMILSDALMIITGMTHAYDLRLMAAVYGAILLISLFGRYFGRNGGVGQYAGGLVAGSLAFFLITNAAVWAFGTYYSPSLDGLWAAYMLGLPFLKNSLLSDLLFGGAFLAAYQYYSTRTAVRVPVTVSRRS